MRNSIEIFLRDVCPPPPPLEKLYTNIFVIKKILRRTGVEPATYGYLTQLQKLSQNCLYYYTFRIILVIYTLKCCILLGSYFCQFFIKKSKFHIKKTSHNFRTINFWRRKKWRVKRVKYASKHVNPCSYPQLSCRKKIGRKVHKIGQ